MDKLGTKVAQLRAKRKKRNAWMLAVGAVMVAVAVPVVAAMRLPGFTQQKTAYCGMEEHTHTDECLGQEGGCSLAEHEHSLACYSNPQTDVESQEEWEKTIPVFENEAPRLWREVRLPNPSWDTARVHRTTW